MRTVQGAMFGVQDGKCQPFVCKKSKGNIRACLLLSPLQYFCPGTEGAPWRCWDQMKPFLTCVVNGVLVKLCDHTHLKCKRHESPRRSRQLSLSSEFFLHEETFQVFIPQTEHRVCVVSVVWNECRM